MVNNPQNHWSNRPWVYWTGLWVLVTGVVAFATEWGEALKWWSNGAAPHESLRNLGLMLAGFIGIALATWRSTVAAAQAKTAQQGHITDRYSRAVEQLGSDNVTVRIGGIYALKRIAQDSLDRDHISVMEVLTNFIRHSPYAKQQRAATDLARKYDEYTERATRDEEFAKKTEPPQHPRFMDCPDIIAAIDTIRTRSDDQKSLEATQKYTPTLKKANFSYLLLNDVDLSGFDLNGVNLNDANITGVNLSNTDLSGYDLKGLDLSCAILSGIDLSDTDLFGAILLGVRLDNATLERTNLSNVDLRDANLTGANLTGAKLAGANLTNADLANADLTNADLRRADLTDVNLSNTNLSGTNLSCTNLKGSMVSYSNFKNSNAEYANLTVAEFEQIRDHPYLFLAFTRPGQPPRNLLDGVDPPPERDED